MKLTHIYLGDDWEGWYLEDKLLCEGHTISARELIEILGYHVETGKLYDPDEELSGLPLGEDLYKWAISWI